VTRDPWARKVRAYHLADVRCFVKLEGMGANIAAPLRANRLAHKKVRPRSDAATDGDRWGAWSMTGGLIRRTWTVTPYCYVAVTTRVIHRSRKWRRAAANRAAGMWIT